MTVRPLASNAARAQSLALPIVLLLAAAAWGRGGANEIVLAPDFTAQYEVIDLGPPPGVPGSLGGIAFDPADPDRLLVGGFATTPAGAIYAVPVDRDPCGRIEGYAGAAVLVATAPHIDGGLAVGPGGVLLFTAYDTNELGQVRPGDTEPSRTIDLTPLGVEPSTGGVAVVPAGFPGAGRLKIVSYDQHGWYDAVLVPDGAGTFDVTGVQVMIGVPAGPEGIAYLSADGIALPRHHVLVNKWDDNRVDLYEIDEAGNPQAGTGRVFLDSLFGAEGAAVDPVTGDVVLSTLGVVSRVAIVRIGRPCREDIAPREGDGVVGQEDLLLVLSSWEEPCIPADIDRDGVVGFTDVLEVLLRWGPCR